MRVQQIAQALTLSVALAGIGLITAAPASATEDVKVAKTRVKIGFVEWEVDSAGPFFRVRGRVQSPDEECERHRWVKLTGGHRQTEMDRGHTSPRGRFSLGLRQGTYRSHYSVKAPGPAGRFYFGPPRADGPREDGSLICQADSTRFRVPPPPSEAQIAAAPASATEDGKAVKTRVKIKRITTVDYGTYGPYWRVVGVVRSSEHACERRREYRLRIIDRRSNAGAAGYEAQYTSLQGEFWVELPQGEEDRITYRVMAPRSFPPQGRGRSHICKRDGSRRFTLSTP